MENRFLALGKLMVLILALLSPVLFWSAYHNQRDLLVRDASVRDALSDTRFQTMQDTIYGYFDKPEMLARATLSRKLPDGPIHGLGDFPDADTFFSSCGFELGPTPNVNPDLYTMLWDTGSFFSGLPRRYAGLVEILRLRHPKLGERDLDRIYSVASQLYLGEGLVDDDLGYLIERMPPGIQTLFLPQRHFLGHGKPESQGFWVSITANDTRYLLELSESMRHQLNRALDAFGYETDFMPSDHWLVWDNMALTLTPTHAPSRSLRKAALIYGVTGLGVELVLVMLYLVLLKYEKVNRAQKRLLATTSHELRTPLAVIRQFSEMLMDRQDHVPQRFRPWHGFIHRESMKMQFLVENLLSAARFENFAFKPSPTQIDLKEWMTGIVDSVSGLTEDHQISLECPHGRVFWDASMMNQVLVNLLENARIHAGTDVEVTVTREGKSLRLCVRDFGQDVNLNQVRAIEAFKTVEGRKSGLGLGLYLVNRIVTAHRGTLGFEAAHPGLRVVMILPERFE